MNAYRFPTAAPLGRRQPLWLDLIHAVEAAAPGTFMNGRTIRYQAGPVEEVEIYGKRAQVDHFHGGDPAEGDPGPVTVVRVFTPELREIVQAAIDRLGLVVLAPAGWNMVPGGATLEG